MEGGRKRASSGGIPAVLALIRDSFFYRLSAAVGGAIYRGAMNSWLVRWPVSYTHLAVIVICALPGRQEICPGFFPQDCGAVAMSIWLTATAMGLGAVWCGVYPDEGMVGRVAQVVGTPQDVVP